MNKEKATGARVGYARVSREDQVIDRQLDALNEDGCVRVFTDQGVSGAKASRPGLDECLNYLRTGDTLVVQSLDRLGRSTRNLLELVESLSGRGVDLRILNIGIDTSTTTGRLILTLLGALAEMERELLRERTRDGLAAAKARGRHLGRQPALTPEQIETVGQLHDQGYSQLKIASVLGVSPRTVGRALDRVGVMAVSR